MAKVIEPFKGVPDGKIYPIDFAEGDTVEGELAAVAIAEGWAEAPDAPKRGRGAKAASAAE